MTRIWKAYAQASLILRVTVALVLGVVVGLIGGEAVAAWLAPLGDLLLRLLTFLIVPIVLFTLMVGVNQSREGRAGRVGGKVFGYYLTSSALAIMVGLAVATLFSPGSGMTLDESASFSVPENPGVVDTLLNIVPDNIIGAFAELNMLGIIFTALVFGIALLKMRQSERQHAMGERLYGVIEALNEVTLKVMSGVLHYVPIGVFAIVAETVSQQGLATLLSLGDMVVVLYIALATQLLIYCGIMRLFGVKLRTFFREARTPMATAFATQSSSGTLPLTVNAAHRLGIPKSIYGFSLPLGATLNMDGAAIRIAISAVFAANVIGAPLDFISMVQIVLIGTLVSVGTAGVPGAGIIMIATVFAQVGLPIETVALLTAIDALVGMGCTALNVTGDLVGTSVIARSEGEELQEEPVEDAGLAVRG
ncbi:MULTISPECIES: dicarboxylate/amino acid:cation symporter [unclassified Halomonas]|uniref:dicarboxylate/amino acid:cation symporter n=1 Tax=unclassified Halomonas TaxID=2609666 RepID=UPI0004B3C8F4|nr:MULTISPECIES: dicarboxylate/amino acid:cation symporter [unclassified Halomonas]KIN15905.1 sodium:dicarboxylate symporter [Halomonas sp. KHS3]NAO96280.1 cation:dicarboxylase symporter family transporter [Halomonas sp. MG34]PKH58712.1 dicarboxylate/amino acid:cation symporter [Halomonas sp. Choline-3u-9]QGQ69568.1 dicarboxylate/amino acid:cation symporter [Halomonas sp. PA16-9]